MRGRWTLLGIVLLSCLSCGAPEQTLREAATLEEALALSAGGGGLVVVDFWRDG